MTLRVREICKEKGITMKELAEKIGINPITLTQSINGNPTLSRLTEVAKILDVDVADLFRKSKPKNDVHGCIYVNGTAFLVNTFDDLTKLYERLSIENEKLKNAGKSSTYNHIWDTLFKDAENQPVKNTEKTTI